MTTAVDVANLALDAISFQATLTSLTDGSTAANLISLKLPIVTNRALTAQLWRFPRAVATLVPNATSSNPLWQNEFALPAGALKVVGVLNPNDPTWRNRPAVREFEQGSGVPFDQGANATGPVIWANLPRVPPAAAAAGVTASLAAVYISSALTYDQWPSSFLDMVVYALAAEIALPLTGNGQLKTQAQQGASQAMRDALLADAPRSLQSTDYVPDWIAVRGFFADREWRPVEQMIETFSSGFIAETVGSESVLPSWLTPAATLNGVPNAGMDAGEIGAAAEKQYVDAWTPDGRIGVLEIGVSPVAWTRPYHGQLDAESDASALAVTPIDEMTVGSTPGDPIEDPEGYES